MKCLFVSSKSSLWSIYINGYCWINGTFLPLGFIFVSFPPLKASILLPGDHDTLENVLDLKSKARRPVFRDAVKKIQEKLGLIFSRFLIFLKTWLIIYDSEGLDLNPDSSLRCLTTVKLVDLCCLSCKEAGTLAELKVPFSCRIW